MVKLHPSRDRSAATTGGLLGALVLLLGTAPARADASLTATRVNRYVTLSPSGPHLGVTVMLLYGGMAAAERRRELDTDHDGQLAPAEVAADRRAWIDRASTLVRLEIDGAPAALELDARIDLHGASGVAAEALLVELTGTRELDPGEHRLHVTLGPDLPHMGATEIALDPGAPWSLRGGGADGAEIAGPAPGSRPTTRADAGGAARAGVRRLVRYPTPRAHASEERGATFVIRPDGRVEPNDNPAVPIVLVGFAVVLGVALTFAVHRMGRAARPRKAP